MRSVSSMSDSEIRDALKFTRRWFDLGIVDDAWVALAVREYRNSDDQGDEHYRYGAFVHFLGGEKGGGEKGSEAAGAAAQAPAHARYTDESMRGAARSAEVLAKVVDDR